VLARKALVTALGSAPGGAAPFAATRARADFATCSEGNQLEALTPQPSTYDG